MRPTILMLLWFVDCGLHGQSYRPLLEPSSVWQDFAYTADLSTDMSTSYCVRYFLAGDTLVNDTIYKVVRMNGTGGWGISYPPYPSNHHWYSSEYATMLREDTLTRRVYIRDHAFQYEELLYDFAAEIGPYPSTWMLWEGDEVVDIDSVALPDGLHRRIHLSFGLLLIEGVGSNYGLLPFHASTTFFSYGYGKLICYTKDLEVLYEDPLDGCPCREDLSIEEQRPIGLRLAPVPASDECHLSGPPGRATYTLRTMDGRALFHGTTNDAGQATLDLTRCSSGSYLVEMNSPHGRLCTKLIKQ